MPLALLLSFLCQNSIEGHSQNKGDASMAFCWPSYMGVEWWQAILHKGQDYHMTYLEVDEDKVKC